MQASTQWQLATDAAEKYEEILVPVILGPAAKALVDFADVQPGETVLDIGCGTGSLSLLLAELGHTVIGIDFAAAMIDRARQKAAAAGQVISFQEMAAANPQFPPAYFDLVLCRHLLWVLPEPKTVLQRWVALLKPAGRLLLVEGFWHTGGGLHQAEVVAALPTALTNVHVQDLSTQPALWGTNVDDERYLLTAECTDGD